MSGWIAGNIPAPRWINGALATSFLLLAIAAYARHGYDFEVVFCAWAFGVRGTMFTWTTKKTTIDYSEGQ